MKIYKNKISQEKIKQAQELALGLTQSQWCSIKSAIDYTYSSKAGQIKLASLEETDSIESILQI